MEVFAVIESRRDYHRFDTLAGIYASREEALSRALEIANGECQRSAAVLRCPLGAADGFELVAGDYA